MLRVLVVSNPVATGVDDGVEHAAVAALAPYAEVVVVHTERRLHARELAAAAPDDGFDAVVVLAGDGTANEVVNGLGARLPIGVLPAGGTSVLARAVGLPRDVAAAATRIGQALTAGRERALPVGTLNGRRFAFNAGIGIDADVVRRVDRRGRRNARRPGDAYFTGQIGAVIARGRYGAPCATLEIDGEEIRCASVLVANLQPWSFVGPLPVRLAPRAEAELGLDVVAPAALRRRDVPTLLRYLLVTGGHAAGGDRRIAYRHDVAAAVVRCDRPLAAQVDGDDVGDLLEVTIGVDPDGMRLLA